jgi:molybdopterin adenylyltransferase
MKSSTFAEHGSVLQLQPARPKPGGGVLRAVLLVFAEIRLANNQVVGLSFAMPLRLAILTISDAGSRGERSDSSGDLIASWAKEHGYSVAERSLVPDDTVRIAGTLAEWSDGDRADLILTSGGTGLTERDVTPEATRAILDKEAPGIAEALRVTSFARFPRAALSRGLAGVRGKTLIVNLPGSPGGVRDGLGVLSELVEHAVELVRGVRTAH